MLDQLSYAQHLVQRERFRDAYAVLAALPHKTAFVKWKLGVVLTGLNETQEALSCLLEALIALDGADKAMCNLDIAILHNRSGQAQFATPYLDEAETMLVELQRTDDLLALQVVRTLSLQILGKHQLFLARVEMLVPRLKSHPNQVWIVILALAASSRYIQMGDLDRAESMVEQYLPLAVALDLPYRVGLLQHQLARICHQRGQLRQAGQFLDEARQNLYLSGSALGMGDVAQLQGVIHYEQGNWDAARHFFAQAIRHYQLSHHLQSQALCYFNLGILESDVGNYQAALASLWRAEDTVRPLVSSWILANIRFACGKLHQQLGNVRYAKDRLLAAANDFEHSQRYEWAAHCTALLYSIDSANTILKQQWLSQTISYLQRCKPNLYREIAAMTLGEQLLINDHAFEARPWLTQSMNWFDQANMLPEWARASLLCLESELVLEKCPSDLVWQKLLTVEAKMGLFPEFALRIALLRAKYMYCRPNNGHVALGYLQVAIGHISFLRRHTNDLVLASRIAGRFEPIFCNALQLAITLNASEVVAQLSEQRRALWLKQIMSVVLSNSADNNHVDANKISINSEVMQSLLYKSSSEHQRLAEEGQKLRFSLIQASNRPQLFDAGQLSMLQSRVALWQRQCDDFDARQMLVDTGLLRDTLIKQHYLSNEKLESIDEISQTFCRRFGLNWTAIAFEPLSTGWLLLKLTSFDFTYRILHLSKTQTAMLAYIVNPRDDHRKIAYCSQHPAFSKIAQVLKLDEWVGIDSNRSDQVNHTLIIADSAEWNLDFAALPMGNGVLLGQQAIIRYVPSWGWAAKQCKTWLLQKRQNPPIIKNVLVIAPIEFNGRHLSLPHSLEEIEACQRIFPCVRIFQGADASIQNLTRLSQQGELANYDLIHFASHACQLANQPRFSAISLYDGELTLQTILTLRMRARYVSISACQTGLSVSYGGEERIGIETVMLSAGASTVLTAMWSMRDTYAASLMVDTMTNLAACEDIGLALTQSQRARQLLGAPMLEWAGWHVTGID